MSFDEKTLYARNDDDLDDFGDPAGYGDSAERHADGKSDRKRDKHAAGVAQGNGRFELGRIELGKKPRE